MNFDDAILEDLLNMEEGPTLDFKREQYRFNGATDTDKSSLLKDILAFANTRRDSTAYILIGVEEVEGGQNLVVGVQCHLEDANLHQFVNSKTNRPVEFRYSPFPVEGKQIGVISISIQDYPVYARHKYGRVDANAVYLRDGSSTRPASPEEIASMGRANPPKLVEWSTSHLRTMATNAILTTAQDWRGHPYRHAEYGAQKRLTTYEEARDWVLGRSLLVTDYTSGINSYGSLHWVFTQFEELALLCTRTIRTVGSALIEYGALMQAMLILEENVESERVVWEEFRMRVDSPNSPLPVEASFNLLAIAALTVRFVYVIDDKEHIGDPNYDSMRRFQPAILRRSDQWGNWR